MKNNENWALMMKASKQYYQLGLSQDEIAKNLYISKSTVSRLIKKSVELGYVEFKIHSFGETDEALQRELEDEFGVRCVVLPTLIDAYSVRLNDICAYAAGEVFDGIEDGETIAFPWGKTIEYLAANVTEPIERFKDLKICMLNGFLNGSIHAMRAIHIVEKLSTMLNAKGYVMPCPLLVQSAEMKKMLLDLPSIRAIYEMAENAETAIISVGPFDMQHTSLTELGADVVEHLRQFDGAGNLAGRTYDINGREFETDLTPRLMSIPLEELARKRLRVCIAVGEHKARAIVGMMRGRIINRLYTDANTARAILRIQAGLGAAK